MLTLQILLFKIFPLVMQLLAFGHADLNLDLAFLKVQPQRHSGTAVLPDSGVQFFDLPAMQQ
jgi:hypothetical protein